MKKRAGFSLAVFATAILLLCQVAPRALAQDQNYPPDQAQEQNYPPDQPQAQGGDEDPPTIAGRLSDIEGSVSFQAGGQGDWLDAVRNRPLTVGDNLWVDKDSRAEIQIGSTSIRLGPETSVTFLDLGNNVTQLRLSLGSIYFRVRQFGGDDAFEVDTPNLAFNVSQAGSFRLDTNENGDQTIATVFHGEGEVTGGGNSYRLGEGQEGTFSGTDQLSYDVGAIQDSDAFTQWALSRDQREDRAQSRQYVSQDMTGYEDLDDYGRWRNDPQYGNVWQPSGVSADWAPYRYGHWAYVYPWGWTWVEDEPWGFAPFHYGRWAYAGSSWCWVPGPIAVAPVYAPALVAFVGGAGFSVGIGVDAAPVGWFPLGPREVFVPWYHTSPRYVQRVNVTNTRVTVVQVTNVYNNYTTNHVTNVTYVNQHVRNSITVVNHDTFVNARPVNRNIEHVDARQLANARVMPAEINRVQPARQSVMGVSHPVKFQPPPRVMSRQVVATRQPVSYNRGGGPAIGRPAPPPPVRTVRPAPRGQAQQLQRGARGGPNPGAPNNRPENRPGQPNGPENRGAAPGQPNNRPENRPGQPNNGPENRGAAPAPGQPNNRPENRPGQPNNPGNNRNVPRPGGPGNNNPNARPNENAPRPGGPGNNGPGNNPNARPNENVPRPGGPGNNNPNARPNENAPRPGAPENRPAPPDNRNARPDNNHNVPRPPSASHPEQQPRQYPGTRPENTRPQENPQARPEQPSRPAETPQTRPEQPARPPETRQPAPPPENRPETQRNNPRPEARPAEPPPQREARPAEPPPQREARPSPPPQRESHPAPAPRNERPPKEEKPPKENKEPPKGR
jgi:hypothetical protein